jgi:hypothetical protein
MSQATVAVVAGAGGALGHATTQALCSQRTQGGSAVTGTSTR